MRNLEGKIHIRLAWDGQRIRRASLEPRALVQIGAMLRGKSAQHAAQLVPRLFSLCGKAQASAAATALEAAQGESAPSALLKRERLVLAEALQETLWRLLLDLPGIMGMEANPALLAQVRRRCAQACALEQNETAWQHFAEELGQTVNHALFGTAITCWRDMADIEQLMCCLRQANTTTANIVLACWRGTGRWGASAVGLMPPADRASVLAALAPGWHSDADFARYPHWHGQPMETGALARMRAHPVLAALLQLEGTSILTRLLARLYELEELLARLHAASLPPQPWVQGTALGAGVALAWVQTARGLLLHRVALDRQGMIEDYCIVAPTEWNFHPAGACVQGLAGQTATSAEQARRSAELLVQALDPCVAYHIEVDHA